MGSNCRSTAPMDEMYESEMLLPAIKTEICLACGACVNPSQIKEFNRQTKIEFLSQFVSLFSKVCSLKWFLTMVRDQWMWAGWDLSYRNSLICCRGRCWSESWGVNICFVLGLSSPHTGGLCLVLNLTKSSSILLHPVTSQYVFYLDGKQ